MHQIAFEDRQSTDIGEALTRAERLIGKKTGLIRYLLELESEADDFGVSKYYAYLSHTSRFAPLESSRKTGSAALSWQRAKAAAVGEAIERYCCSFYDVDNFVFASYSEMQDDAVAPGDFALFSEEQYSQPGFRYSRFSRNSKVNWVWGYSLIEQRSVLVPACFVYMPYRPMSGETRIKEAITTGAAAGSSLEEATLSAIYEAVERDAFTIMWLNKLPAPKVDLSSFKNQAILRFVDRVRSSNLRLVINYIATDVGIPVFFGMLVDESGNKPVVAVGAAASLDPELGILHTLEEVVQTRDWARRLVKQEKESGPFHLQSFEDVKDFEDHVLLYAWKDLREAFDFLLNSSRSVTVDEIPNLSSKSVLENVSLCREMLAAKGMDVIAVNITTPDITEVGFTVMKVIVPGLQPLNGDYAYRCLGGRRLYEVPRILGYAEEATEEASLNPYPHPFP